MSRHKHSIGKCKLTKREIRNLRRGEKEIKKTKDAYRNQFRKEVKGVDDDNIRR